MVLSELLEIQPGVTAVIGGGGKTTLLETLGKELSARGSSVLLCTTTKMYPYEKIPFVRTGEEIDQKRQEHLPPLIVAPPTSSQIQLPPLGVSLSAINVPPLIITLPLLYT